MSCRNCEQDGHPDFCADTCFCKKKALAVEPKAIGRMVDWFNASDQELMTRLGTLSPREVSIVRTALKRILEGQ